MKNEITIPDHLPVLKEEGSKAAARRREEYSVARDIQAKEYNEAITNRLAKEKREQESIQNEVQIITPADEVIDIS